MPSSILNCKSLSALGTLLHSSTVPTRMSILPKSSKATVAFTSAGVHALSWFCFLVSNSLLTCASMVASSICSKRSSGFSIVWPSIKRFAFPACCQPIAGRFMMRCILSAVKGRKGAHSTARLAHICKERLSTVAVRSGSVLMSFHGSVSVRYLLPKRARFIISAKASRKR